MKWYLEVLSKYAVFTGRARRSEYWYFALLNTIFLIALGILEGALGLFPDSRHSVLGLVYNLAVFFPALAVSVRRLHDTGRSGWWLLIAIVPLLGAIALLVFMLTDSDAGKNEYGPNPKAA